MRLAICAILLAAVQVLSAQSSVTELNEAGWKALQDGNGDRAARLFGEALSMRPNDPVLLLGAGASAEAQGKPRDAMARLKQALALNPQLTPASRLLGQIAYQEGEAALAIQTYQDALKYAPGDAALTNQLSAWRQDHEIHQQFEERRYNRFRVMFEGPAVEALAAQATEVLNTAFWQIGAALGEYPSDTVVAILYSEKQFRDITRAPEWSDGEYDGRIRIPVAGASEQPARFARVLTHELTHAIVSSLAPRGIPAWLHEGLAQHFDGADPQAARRRIQARHQVVPLSALDRGFSRLSAVDAQLAYDESLVAVQAMFERPGFGWGRLLSAAGADQPFERVLASFGFSYADLEAGFK